MRLRLLNACCFAGAMALCYAQVPADRDLKLVGDRFAPLIWATLTPEQKVMVEHLFTGERHGAGGPFNVLLRAPELGDELQAYGAYIRYHPSLPRQITELVIMTSVRYWNTESEWNAHKTIALRAASTPRSPALSLRAYGLRTCRPTLRPPTISSMNCSPLTNLLTGRSEPPLTDSAKKAWSM